MEAEEFMSPLQGFGITNKDVQGWRAGALTPGYLLSRRWREDRALADARANAPFANARLLILGLSVEKLTLLRGKVCAQAN